LLAVEFAHAHPARLCRADQPVPLQHPDMLDEGGERHRGLVGQFADAGWSMAKPIEHSPPGRICKGKENPVKLCMRLSIRRDDT